MAQTETTQRVAPTAGGKLRAAREAAGLSIDAVAQQLKLAPRQVTALEEDDWHRLPGRTFVRGFARNYARFVHLDPDAVLALLPASDTAAALERPTLAAARRPMGELPVEGVTKPSPLRFVIPLAVLAAIGVFAYHELSQSSLHLPARVSSFFSGKDGNSSEAANAETPATGAAVATSGGAPTAALPNPVATGTALQSGGTAASDVPGISVLPTPSIADTTAGATRPAATATNTTPPTAAVTAASAGAPASGATSTTASTPASAPSTTTLASANAIAADVPLVLTFKGTSWAEVKDAKGRVVLQMTGGAGMTQTVTAAPPIELALGNAPNVAVTFRGQSLDLSPYTRGNVARVSLQ